MKVKQSLPGTDQASSLMSDKVTKNDTIDSKTLKIVDNSKPQWHLRADVGGGARFIGQLTPVMVLGLRSRETHTWTCFYGHLGANKP